MSDSITRVLFVCHGNICRSTMAECIFQNLVDEADVGNQFQIDSAACTTDEIGMPIYPAARKTLEAHSIAIVPHKARLIQPEDGEKWDYIVCMDEENVDDLERLLPADAQPKVHKLMSFTGSSRDVADPWYTRDFEAAYNDILAGCIALLEETAH